MDLEPATATAEIGSPNRSLASWFWSRRARAGLRWPAPARYGVALLLAVGALTLSTYAQTALRPTVLLLPYLAVVVAAYLGGLGPALLTALASAAGAELFLLEPYGAVGLGGGAALRVGVLLTVALLTGVLTESLFEAVARARTAAARARTLRARLRDAERDLRVRRTEAEAARSEARSARLAGSHFLRVVSHELRTPLSAIIGYQELLTNEVAGPLGDVQKQQLDRIGHSARHLLALIEQVLSLSRIQAGTEEVECWTLSLPALVREATASVAPLAAAKGLELRLDVPPDLVVNTDGGKLRRILLNLLANAVDFTEAGVVEVVARRTDGGVTVVVRDTGIGIPEDEVVRIFEPFAQGKPGSGALAPAAGFGLALARALVELLGGDISVESREGSGSSFTVRLPTA